MPHPNAGLGLLRLPWLCSSPSMAADSSTRQPRGALDRMPKGGLGPGSQRDWQAGIDLLEGACDPSQRRYHAAITTCGRAGQWRLAVELLRRMSDCGHSPTAREYNGAASSCARGGSWEDALRLLEEMQAAGVAWDSFSFATAISAYGKGGLWAQALELLRTMEAHGFQPNAVHYGAAISACGRCGYWEQSIKLLEKMRKRGKKPSLVCYNAAISACDKAEKVDAALRLFDELAAAGLKADVYSYSSAIAACSRAPGRWKQSLRLFARMKRERVRPNGYTYSAAAGAYASAGAWEAALVLLSDMKRARVRPNALVFCSIISACASQGQWRAALSLVRGMRSQGVAPDAACFNAAIAACARGRASEKAVELFDQMGESATVYSYSSALSALVKSGQWRDSLRLLDKASDRMAVGRIGVPGLEAKCSHAGLWHGSQMLQSEVPPNLVCFTVGLAACKHARQADTALGLWREMAQRRVKADGVATVAVLEACAVCGEWCTALNLVDKLTKGVPEFVVQDGLAGGVLVDGGASIETLSPRARNAQMSNVCTMLDSLHRLGMPHAVLSLEGAMVACEQFGLGRELEKLMMGEYSRRVSEPARTKETAA